MNKYNIEKEDDDEDNGKNKHLINENEWIHKYNKKK
jgi:hypothetical protein